LLPRLRMSTRFTSADVTVSFSFSHFDFALDRQGDVAPLVMETYDVLKGDFLNSERA